MPSAVDGKKCLALALLRATGVSLTVLVIEPAFQKQLSCPVFGHGDRLIQCEQEPAPESESKE